MPPAPRWSRQHDYSDALAREMMAAFYQEFEPDIGISEWPDWQNVADIALAHIAAARAEALEEAAAKCDDLQAFGDAHEGNGNSKAWARAAESLASQIRALVEQKL